MTAVTDAKDKGGETRPCHITPPNFVPGELYIRGTRQLVQNKFGRRKNDPFEDARYISFEGWDGIPVGAFRHACVDACKLVGIVMTRAKLGIHLKPDGFDSTDGISLVKIIGDPPEELHSKVRVASGREFELVRPCWNTWGARLRFEYDADQFQAVDVMNLVIRAGAQIGIGDGRSYRLYGEKNPTPPTWGTFEVVTDPEEIGKMEEAFDKIKGSKPENQKTKKGAEQ
jgi:hypothetical protein